MTLLPRSLPSHPTSTRVGVLILVAVALRISAAIPPASANRDPAPSTVTSPIIARRLTNSLEMQFTSIPGTRTLFSIWETRVQDYQAFREATGRAWNPPAFQQGHTHPVVNVSWDDAQAFCDWLTAKERKEERLTAKERYRLPTDQEWNLAVGLGPEQGKTPEDRMKTQRIWPWGTYWPPLSGDGNYGPEVRVDAFAETAPVASFNANAVGIHDLGGNVWEWCDDWYNEARVTRVLRGGSFNDSHPAYLLASYRFNGTMNLSNEDFGFRIVLERKD